MPRAFLADEHASNVALVQEVQKYPCLYNYKLEEYARRDIVEGSWEKIAAAVDDTVGNCKERWRNLRTVFVRKQKIPLNNCGRRNSKPYYLNELMLFIKPFVKGLHSDEVVGNTTPSSSSKMDDETVQSDDAEDLPISVVRKLSSNKKSRHLRNNVLKNAHTECDSNNSGQYKVQNIKTKRELCDGNYDEGLLHKKKIRSEECPRKLFLLSLLPDIEGLSDSQYKVFRRKLLDAIDYAESIPDYSKNCDTLSFGSQNCTSVMHSPNSELGIDNCVKVELENMENRSN